MKEFTEFIEKIWAKIWSKKFMCVLLIIAVFYIPYALWNAYYTIEKWYQPEENIEKFVVDSNSQDFLSSFLSDTSYKNLRNCVSKIKTAFNELGEEDLLCNNKEPNQDNYCPIFADSPNAGKMDQSEDGQDYRRFSYYPEFGQKELFPHVANIASALYTDCLQKNEDPNEDLSFILKKDEGWIEYILNFGKKNDISINLVFIAGKNMFRYPAKSVFQQEQNYNPANRPWYIQNEKWGKEDCFISDAYSDAVRKEGMVRTVVCPLSADGKEALLGIDLKFETKTYFFHATILAVFFVIVIIAMFLLKVVSTFDSVPGQNDS